MVAAVATDDPEIAAKPEQAVMVASPSPPRRWPTQARAAPKSSPEIPDRVAKTPIRMNIGMREVL